MSTRPKPFSLYGDPSPEKMEQIDKMFEELYQDLDITNDSTDEKVEGPSSSTDNAIARWDGTDGQTLQNSSATIDDSGNLTANNFSGSSSGTNTGDVTLAGTPNYITIAAQVITRSLIDLASHITGRLPYANFIAATAASRLVGRRSGSSGDFEEVSLGTGLSMSVGAVLSSDRADPALTYLTSGAESASLPNSRRLIAGSNITIDTSVANQATIASSGGEDHDDGYWTPLTDGDTTQPELIFDSNGDAIMMWVATP